MPPKNNNKNKITKPKDQNAENMTNKVTKAVKNMQSIDKSATPKETPGAAFSQDALPSFSLTTLEQQPTSSSLQSTESQENQVASQTMDDYEDTTDDETVRPNSDMQIVQVDTAPKQVSNPSTSTMIPLEMLSLADDPAINRTIAALQQSTSAVQKGMDLMESIFAEYKDLHKHAPEAEKKKAMQILVQSDSCTMYTRALQDTTETIKNVTQIALLHSQASASKHSKETTKPEEEIVQEAPSHLYEVRMQKIPEKTPEELNVIQIFEAATQNINLNVINYENRAGSGYFKLTSKEYAEKATECLKTAKHDELSLHQIYDISFSIISNTSIRLIKMKTTDIRQHVIWLDSQMKVKHDLAADILVRRNNDWCKSSKDIDFILLNPLPGGYKVIQIFISTVAHDRLMILGRKSFKVNIGNGITAQAFLDVREVVCLRCLDFDHTMPTCRKRVICKHCTGGHPSGECKTRVPLKCIRCIRHNQKNPQQTRDTGHNALDYNCPEVKHQRDDAWLKRREAAQKRHART